MVALVAQDTVATLVSRTGRHLQRYCVLGRRQVVGCVPYRLKSSKSTAMDINVEDIEVLMISSQKGNGMLFPKGGWELDESRKEEAALRETFEEAGVKGEVGVQLGNWSFKSKSHDTYYDGYMFPLRVQEQLDSWPEKDVRKRSWMNVFEARKLCQYWWMKEALDRLVELLTSQKQQNDEKEL